MSEKWKARFFEAPALNTLEDAARSGRPATIPLSVRCQLVRFACERPDDFVAPFRNIWTYKSLADALEMRTGVRLSTSEVGRILRFKEIRPHQYSSGCTVQIRTSCPAKKVCDVHLNPPKDAVVVCVDEKPMQVLARKHPTHVTQTNGSVRRPCGDLRQ